MKNSLDVRRQAAALLEEAKAIQEKAEAENRKTTEQEDTDIDAKVVEAGGLSKEATKLEALQRALDGLKEDVTPKLLNPQPGNGSVPAEPKDRDEEARHGWKSLGEFARGVWAADSHTMNMVDRRLMWAAASGMNQAVGSEGGFAVPPAFGSTIWDRLNGAPDNLLGRTDQYTVEGESLTLMANAETNRTAGYRYGGIKGYWIAEAAKITSSAPTLRRLKLEPQQMGVLVYVTEKLLKNSVVALDQYITRAATEEILFLTGDSIINGTGAGMPKGILNSATAYVSVAKENLQAAKTIVAENIVKMWARMHPRARANAIWLINVDAEPQLHLMTIGVGTSGLPCYMPPGGLSGAPYATLMGRPVVPCEYCATLGTLGDIILADMSAYATGVKGGVESAMSAHLRFDYAEECFRFLFSVDGQPWLETAITPFKGSNTLSPFVVLAVRA
jgi:HK97 family phage major capsid protein